MAENTAPAVTAIVTGASRGLGRAIATALAETGAQVIGVARDRASLEKLRGQLGGAFIPAAADATDPVTAAGAGIPGPTKSGANKCTAA
jgi:NADP-dependent 3-hydroxy acid dehydrogenase YdfG